jgi:hypothetical protein
VARSRDGINFTGESPILSTRLIPGTWETSYARVFEHRLPGHDNTVCRCLRGASKSARSISSISGLSGSRRVALGASFFRGSGQADDNAFCTVRNPTP